MILDSLVSGYRELNGLSRKWQKLLLAASHANLELDQVNKLRHSDRTVPINWIDLDHSVGRYLLSASADASIAIFDTQQQINADAGTGEEYDISPIAFLPRSTGSGHKFSVTTCQWFPTDTGLFITASDNEVRLYDTNALLPICIFKGQGKATSARISRALGSSSESCLIAAGSLGCSLVRLGDPRTGAFTHSLIGHNGPVIALDWSLGNPHEIVSGDGTGLIKVWDIRRPIALHTLDRNSTQRQHNSTEATATKKPKHDAPLSHQAPIHSLAPHPNLLFWVSCGLDQKVMLWESSNPSWINRLVNFPVIPSASLGQLRARQMEVSPCGQTLFIPISSGTLVLDVFSGRMIHNLKVQGSAGASHAIAYDQYDLSLYQGLQDGSIIKWKPKRQCG